MILLRRIGVGLILLAGLSIMGMAASNFAQGKEKEKAIAKKPVGRVAVDWTEQRYTIDFDGKKWEDAIRWLANEADLPLVTLRYKAPAGTLTITTPKGRKYSLAEIYDLINRRLVAEEKFVLLRSDQDLSLYPADEVGKIPGHLIPAVKISDLPARGQTEIVEIVVKLKSGLDAEETAPVVKRMLGDFGVVTPLQITNKLVMRADVATLRKILPEIEPPADDKEGGNLHTFTHQCKYIRASTAEQVLKSALGQLRQVVVVSSSPGAPVETPGGPPGGPKGPGGGGGQTRQQRIRETTIASDKISNTVIITGQTEKIDQAKTILAKLDVPRDGKDKGLLVGGPRFMYHDLPNGSAEAFVKILSEIFKGDSDIRITVNNPSRLFVWADPQTHLEISNITKEVPKTIQETKFFVLKQQDATKFAESLTKMIPDIKNGAPFVEADQERNAIRVRGTPDQIQDIKNIIQILDESSFDGADAGKVRIMFLDKGSGATLAEAIYLLGKRMRPEVHWDLVVPTQLESDRFKLDFKDPKLEKKDILPIPKSDVKPPEKKIAALTPEAMRAAIYTHTTPAPEIQVIFDAKDEKKKEPAKKGPPIRITGYGNRIILNSDDPKLLDYAQQLIRILVNTEAGPGDIEVVRLKWANAAEVAKVLDEAFNGPKQQGGQRGGGGGIGGIAGMVLSGIGGGGGSPARSENIRVVADTGTNTLLVKAKPYDMLTINRLIDKFLDVHYVDNDVVPKTFILGPLKNATAQTVADILQSVFRESMTARSATPQMPVGFPFGGGGQRQIDTGSAAHAQLSVGVDNTTNSLVVHCSTTLYADIKTLVGDLDEAAGNSKQVVQIVSIKDIDPLVVQQVIDSISGRTSATQQRRYGADAAGTFTPGSFAPGAFGTQGRFGGGGNFGGGGGFQGGGFQGGGFNPGVFTIPGGGGGGRGPGGGGTGPGGGGAPRGGGGGGKKGASLDRGPDFFVQRVMDDPSVRNSNTDLYDPSEDQEEPYAPRYREEYLKRPFYTANPVRFVSLEQELLKGPKEVLPAPKDMDSIEPPRLPGQIEVIPGLGVILVKGNKEDVEKILNIIRLIGKASQPALIDIELVPVRYGDPFQITNTLYQLYGRVIVGPYATEIKATTTPGGGFQLQQSTQGIQAVTQPGITPTTQGAPQLSSGAQPANIVLIPQTRPSAILVAASKARMPDIKKQIQLLDQPVSDPHGAKFYPLKRASASQVAQSLNAFYATRFPAPDNINLIRITADVGSNTVIVQASPADMAEIDRLIRYIDDTSSLYENEIKVVQLRTAVATDLAQLLQLSIANNVLAVNQSGVGGQIPAAIPGQAGGQQGITTKDGTVRIIQSQARDGKPVKTRILEDIKVNADIRTNSLVVSAPVESMPLVLALIRELDVQPIARSEINVFTLRKADATLMATMLQQLFLGTGVTGAKPGVPTAPAAPTLPGQAGAGTRPPIIISVNNALDPGAPIIDLRITVDERTNSLIVAGSRNDLLVVETIIARIEDAKVQDRRSEAIRLRNAAATDIANTVTDFLTKSQTLLKTYGQETNALGLRNDAIVVAEPISNSLLINATPATFDIIVNLVAKLDTAAPQVVISVLMAEVTMNGSEEFGMELGLQNPLSFTRGLVPGNNHFIYTTNGAILPTAGVTTRPTEGGPTTVAGGITPHAVGVTGMSDLGLGTASSTNNIGGFVFSANADVVKVLIRALKIQGRINVLSRPQIMTLDKQTAVINVGQEIPIAGDTTTGPTGLITQAQLRRTVGIIMQVTPQITPDGRVVMRVIPEVSSVNPTPINIGNGTTGTALNIQHLETTVSAADGETVLLGGIIAKRDDKNENKVPWLGDLPGIGAAFRYRTYNKTKTEFIIIMTPHIVRNRFEQERVKAEEMRRIDWMLSDVARVHGYGLPPIDGLGSGPGCSPRPYRVYPGPGSEPEQFVPAPTPVEPAPAVQPMQPARAPILRGGLLKSLMSRRSEPAVNPVIPTSPASAPIPQMGTTVQIVPAQPRTPELIPGNVSTPSLQLAPTTPPGVINIDGFKGN